MVTNLVIRIPSCLSFKGRYYYEGGSRVYASAPMGGIAYSMNEMTNTAAPKMTPIVSVRTFFPETWLFNLFESG